MKSSARGSVILERASEPRLQEYQRNATFVFMLFVLASCIVFLTTELAQVLVPLVWAAFFAVPIVALITSIEMFILRLLWGTLEPLKFRVEASGDRVVVNNSPSAVALAENLNKGCMANFCRHRVRIVELQAGGLPVEGHEVNRLVQDWCYYARQVDAMRKDDICLELSVDDQGLYPASLKMLSDDNLMDDEADYEGVLQLDKSSSFSWLVSSVISLGVMFALIGVFLLAASEGVAVLTRNSYSYQTGAQEVIDLALGKLKFIPKDTVNSLSTQANAFVSSAIPGFVASLASHMSSIGVQMMLFVLYLLFWVSEPLPVNNSVATLVKNYLLLKTVVCFLFAGMMSLLIYWLRCPLWPIFGVISFLFNYVPEVGCLAVFLLVVPAILFDGNQPLDDRCRSTISFLVFGLVIKLVTSNIVELHLYTSVGGQYMRMHPVVLLALMMLCQMLLGITGMFLAIPILAALKYYMLSVEMPSVYLNKLLFLVEGNEAGPHKNFIDRHRQTYGAVKRGAADPESPIPIASPA